MAETRKYWLLKSEPSVYSFDMLLKDGKTNWNGIRNFQARNFLREAAVGDTALIYHSNDDKAVVGLAEVARAAYPEPDPETPGDWVQIDVRAVRKLSRPVTLAEMKATPALKDLKLIRQSRLSVSPVSAAEFKAITALAEKPAPAAAPKKKSKK